MVIAAALLILLFVVQSVSSMPYLSTTSDETTHLPSGYTYWKTGEIRLNPQHPPLVKLLCALPLLALDPRLDLSDPSYTAEPPDEWKFGYDFLYGNDARRLLFWGRLPVVAIAAMLGVYLFLWARERFGDVGGLTALVLFACSPNLLAHSHLVTMDLALAAFGFATLYHLWRWGRDHRRRDLVACGILLGLALGSKFSAVLLIPAIGVLGLLDHRRAGRPARELLWLAAPFAVAAAVLWAVYLFPGDPRFYLDGVARVNADHDPNFPYYLMGEFRPGGWWYYFLAAFAFKTPLPSLLVMGVAAWVAASARDSDDRVDDLYIALPVALFVVVTSWKADNIGVRYLLPVYPFLFLFAARLGPRWKTSRPWAIGGAVLLAWYVGAAAWIWPHHLSYFNLAVGGPSRGHLYLDDSNIDWGHGLVELKDWVDREGVGELRLRWDWNGSPDYWGIRYRRVSDREWSSERPPPGIYAFPTHILIRGEVHAERYDIATDWLNRYEPIDRIGYHTWIYRIER